ncbi:MAG TPA: ATP-binding protein [Verrucomicrobiae bacterium]|nr:ATP-binding protein [Verrucomicrobiae bacterium]
MIGSSPGILSGGQPAQLLSETLAQLLSARDADAVISQLLPQVAARIGADAFFSFMVNEKGDAFYLHFCSGMAEEAARSIHRLHFGQVIPGANIESSPQVVVSDLLEAAPDTPGAARPVGLQTYACNPLVIDGQMLGTIAFASGARARFASEQLEFLGVISQYTAVALDRLRAMRDLRKLAVERELAEAQVRYQRDTLERIVRSAPLAETLERLTSDMEALIERDLVAGIFLVDQDGRYLRPIAGDQAPPEWGVSFPNPETAEFKSEAIKPGPRTCWSTPIISSRGAILGAFAIYYRESSEPTTQEMQIVDIATRTAAIAIERQQSEQALKDSQAKLQEYAQTLEHRVAERTASLREAVSQMEEFSYSVSHDLRSPLRAMQGYAKAIMEDQGQKLDDQGRHFLHRIINTSSRMDRLIQDILTYSRLSRREIYVQPVLLERLVNDIIQQYPEMQAPNAVIQCATLHNVVGHEPSLSQAISNLLSNAVKFVAPETKPKVRVWSERRDNFVRLWVEDNGIGVRPEDQRRLFGMFERLHSEQKYSGTGIGLAIVRRAMDRMEGKAGMESDGAHGSKFWLELPAAPPPSS